MWVFSVSTDDSTLCRGSAVFSFLCVGAFGLVAVRTVEFQGNTKEALFKIPAAGSAGSAVCPRLGIRGSGLDRAKEAMLST